MMGPQRVQALLALSLTLVALATAHRSYHRGRYYNTHRFVRPAGRTRIGDGFVPIVHRGGPVTPSQTKKQHFHGLPFPAAGRGGGRVENKPSAAPPGGNVVSAGDASENPGPGLLDTVDVRTNLNVPEVSPGAGVCPPVRLSCTVYRTRVQDCTSDADCGSMRKCCFDSCVQKDVCKSLVPEFSLQQQKQETV